MATCELIWWTGISWCPITKLAVATCRRVATGPSPSAYGGKLGGEIREVFQAGWSLSQVQMLVFGWRQGRRVREITPGHTRGFAGMGSRWLKLGGKSRMEMHLPQTRLVKQRDWTGWWPSCRSLSDLSMWPSELYLRMVRWGQHLRIVQCNSPNSECQSTIPQ